MMERERFGEDALFVPMREHRVGATAELELRTLPDGRLALPVYTSLERLVRCCGDYQPWGAVDSAGFATLQESLGFDLAMVDARIPVEHQHRAPETDDEDIPGSWLQHGEGPRRSGGRRGP